ncbi:hypothetical protein CFC21_014228 [Triticum aestivum]|uniref:Uncharacterized protein n=2 Tax=Triticum aestivum TaxID=4565 RepID=A0A9R1DTZ8_WHEAT|nr:hypothetical protein CFC21_014228 [Triticum aestivum]
MPGLVMLRLRSNNFSSHIPVEIMGLHDVRILDLSNNNFFGDIPKCVGNLKTFTDTAIANDASFDNPFFEGYSGATHSSMGMSNGSFTVVIKGQVLEYGENIVYLMSIDLSCNSLTGEIPEELSSLAGLINFNLSSNLLSGNIPYNIGNLGSLESLDLSKNKLGGEIPQGLSDLTYLSYLNLPYNNLSGKIPSGHQLDILKTDDPASMYIGNPLLCGHPVRNKCIVPPRDRPTREDSARWLEDGLSQMDFLLGLIIGFVTGAWMAFCGLLFKKRWRYVCFRLRDKLYDRLHVISVVTWRKWFENTGNGGAITSRKRGFHTPALVPKIIEPRPKGSLVVVREKTRDQLSGPSALGRQLADGRGGTKGPQAGPKAFSRGWPDQPGLKVSPLVAVGQTNRY